MTQTSYAGLSVYLLSNGCPLDAECVNRFLFISAKGGHHADVLSHWIPESDHSWVYTDVPVISVSL